MTTIHEETEFDLENAIKAKNLTAPRVTQDDVDADICRTDVSCRLE